MELEVQLATYVALIRCNEGHCPLVFSVRKDFLIAHFSHYINYIYYLRIDPVTQTKDRKNMINLCKRCIQNEKISPFPATTRGVVQDDFLNHINFQYTTTLYVIAFF